MSSCTNNIFGYSFWNTIYSLHLYSTKGEAIFKAFLITLSWVGGIFCADPRNTNAFFLFSIAMIMEYMMKLVTEQRFSPKVLPLLLIVINTVVFFQMAVRLFQKETGCPSNFSLYATLVSIAIIWIDTLVLILVEHPDCFKNVEFELKDMRMRG